MARGDSSVDLNQRSKVKEGIWNAEATQRCKQLVWRACREGLPVRSLLLQMGIIPDDATCPCCGTCDETTAHAFLLCKEVRPIWFGSPLGLRLDSLPNVNSTITMLQWMEQCVDGYDKTGMGMVCAVVWGLWHRRNAWLLRKKRLSFEEVMEKAASVFAPVEWVPPKDPFVKANFAASVRENVGTGMGVIYRNFKGETMASATDFLADECYDLEIAETLCYKWAIERSEELWFPQVIFETDCKELYTQWDQFTQGKADDSCYLNELLEECKTILQGTESSLTLVTRTANKVAQCLATVAFDYGDKVWMEEVPNEAAEGLQSDAAAIAHATADQ